MWLQHMPPRIWYMLENQHVVALGHPNCASKVYLNFRNKDMGHFWSRIGELDVENAADYHLNAPGLAVEGVLLIGMLALFFGFRDLLVIAHFFTQKRSEIFTFFSSATLPGPAALTIFGLHLCLGKSPKEVGALAKKSKVGDDAALKAEEPRSVESTADPWPVRAPTSKMVLTTKSLPTTLSCSNYSNSIRIWPFWLYSSHVVPLVIPRVSLGRN